MTGQDCQNDTDDCAEIPCALGRNCTDLSPEDEAAFGRGYNCSDCPAGFAEVDEKCEGNLRFQTLICGVLQLNLFFLGLKCSYIIE